MIDEARVDAFQVAVRNYYRDHGRHDLAWRQPEPAGSFDPYKIMVSELMLQQTQVSRVAPKYRQFLTRFPDLETLARAPLGDVLRVWSGLGYNRRAKFLRQAAQQILRDYGGRFPGQVSDLQRLPGIGPGTAGAIVAYGFNQAVAFIETNIRTVFIHHFFDDQRGVSDREILELVAATLDRTQPREWYWALMDYGSYLKQTVGNRNKQSKSYTRQSRFHGSRRQIRGQVLRLLGERAYSQAELQRQISDDRLAGVLAELVAEALIQKRGQRYHL